MAWCTDCVQPGMTENSWACLPVRMIPSSLREHAHLINHEQSRSSFDTRPSHFGPCPLCGLGEAGSEHIWQWCSAAYMAWAKCGDGSSWRDALAGRCNDRLRLTVVASQVVFLYTSLFGRTSANADVSARRIARAVRAIASTDDIQIEDDEGCVGESLHVDTPGLPPRNALDAIEASKTCAVSHAGDRAQATPGAWTTTHALEPQ